MKQETLIIEMGKFTGEIGLEVYERFKREVDGQWKKIQETQIPKSGALRSRKAIEEMIVVRALDKSLPPLPAKKELERKIGQQISDDTWEKLVQIDGDHTLKELRQECRDKRLPIRGDKKTLVLRLLRQEQL